MPGYAALFHHENCWKQDLPLVVARRAGMAEALRAAGAHGMREWLQEEKVRYQSPTQ